MLSEEGEFRGRAALNCAQTSAVAEGAKTSDRRVTTLETDVGCTGYMTTYTVDGSRSLLIQSNGDEWTTGQLLTLRGRAGSAQPAMCVRTYFVPSLSYSTQVGSH